MKYMTYMAITVFALFFFAANLFAQETFEEAAAEREFVDTAGHWAEDIIEQWAGHGVISGYGGYFRPDDTMTVAEFSTILVRLMNYTGMATFDPERYLDLDPEAWYFETMLKIHAAGVLGPVGGRMNPGNILTRELSAVMLARAFRLTIGTSASTGFRDNSEINFSYRPFVRAMRDAGFMRGFPFMNGYAFRPTQAITRAEIVAVFDSMAGTYVNTPGIFTGEVDGRMLIVAPNVTLSLVTVTGNILVAENASGLVFDDVTARRGEILVTAPGELTVKNSRLFRVILDVRSQDIALETIGATNVEFVEMRSGGRILANQNEFHTVRVINIPDNFREGHLVTIEGNFQTLSNRGGADAVDTRGARQNVTPLVPGGMNTVTATRDVGERIAVEVTSAVLGTAHIIVVSDPNHVPTDDEITRYAPGGHIIAVGNYRVFPGNVETFEFSAFNRHLSFDEQGHVVHVIIEDEEGRIERLSTRPIYFTPGVTNLRVTSATSLTANFDTPFPTGYAVEDAFELLKFHEGIGFYLPVEFRAFNLVRNPLFANQSHTFRIVLMYGAELADGDRLVMRPKNNDKEASATADLSGLTFGAFADIGAVIAVDRSVDFSGYVFVSGTELFYVLSNIYVPGYYNMAMDIVNGVFPGDSRGRFFGHMVFDNPGPVEFFEPGFLDTDFYYLYIFMGFSEIGFFTPVEMFELEWVVYEIDVYEYGHDETEAGTGNP